MEDILGKILEDMKTNGSVYLDAEGLIYFLRPEDTLPMEFFGKIKSIPDEAKTAIKEGHEGETIIFEQQLLCYNGEVIYPISFNSIEDLELGTFIKRPV